MTLKKKIIISITSFLILIILLTAFVIFPIFSEIKEASQSIPLKKQEIAELERKTENLNMFRVQLADDSLDLERNLEKINNLFVDSGRLVDFRKFLYETAGNSKVSLDKIAEVSSSRATGTGNWKFIVLQLDLTGPFANFSNFLKRLESSHNLIEIQNLTIASETRSFEFEQLYSGNIKAKLLIKAYTK